MLEPMWVSRFRWHLPDHALASVVGRPEIAGVLKPGVEPDFGELVFALDIIFAARVFRLGDRSIGTDLQVDFGGVSDSVVSDVQADDLAIGARLIPVDGDEVIGHRLFYRIDNVAAGGLADA